jgi:hypothetical protein
MPERQAARTVGENWICPLVEISVHSGEMKLQSGLIVQELL